MPNKNGVISKQLSVVSDNMCEETGYYYSMKNEEYTFDTLLRKAQEKLRKRKV